MPGLFEEFLLACRSQVATYVVGTFGGIGGYLVKALLCSSSSVATNALTCEAYRTRMG